jgi:hypothetical protein
LTARAPDPRQTAHSHRWTATPAIHQVCHAKRAHVDAARTGSNFCTSP